MMVLLNVDRVYREVCSDACMLVAARLSLARKAVTVQLAVRGGIEFFDFDVRLPQGPVQVRVPVAPGEAMLASPKGQDVVTTIVQEVWRALAPAHQALLRGLESVWYGRAA